MIMELKIWKYPLEMTDTQRVQMPKGAQILTAQMQGQTLCLWALVDCGSVLSKDDREIEIIGTGNPISDASRRYIATVQMCGGGLVWHIFERE
jgi:hypothetical protein